MHFEVSSDVVWLDVPGPVTLFDGRTSRYHVLDEAGSAIWRALAGGDDGGCIAHALAARHDAEESVVAADVRSFLDRACGLGLIVPTE